MVSSNYFWRAAFSVASSETVLIVETGREAGSEQGLQDRPVGHLSSE